MEEAIKSLPELILMKPNREEFGIITEAYEITQENDLGEVPRLTFKVPFKLSVRHRLKDNPNIIKLREKMLVYFEYTTENIKEYFIIQKIIKNHDSSTDELTVECSGLGKQLAHIPIKDYSVVSKNARQLLSDVLIDTSWKIGSIHGEYDTSYRSIDFTGNALQFIYDVAETFEAIAILDSISKTVNLYNPKSYGTMVGSPIGYGKLIENITYETDSEEQATRLTAEGKDGVTIASVTSTGMPYIEDYSYYYDLMSDELRVSLIAYMSFLRSKDGVYNGYLGELNTFRSQLTVKQGELSDLNRELKIIQDTLDVQNSQGQNNSQTLVNQSGKKAQISIKTNEITILSAQITSKQQQITALATSLNINSHLTPQSVEELKEFVFVGEYTNQYVSDPKQLKELAELHFNSVREPKIIVSIGVVNLYAIMDRKKYEIDGVPYNPIKPDMFRLGNFISIEYELSKINITAQIIKKSYDFENNTINLTISNISKAKTYDELQVERLEQSMGYSNAFAASQWAYDNNIARTDEVTQILNDTWSAVDRQIEAGVNNSVSITNRGIWITDSNDPNNILILQNGVMGLSKDGSNSWQTAITPNGYCREKVYGKKLKLLNGGDICL